MIYKREENEPLRIADLMGVDNSIQDMSRQVAKSRKHISSTIENNNIDIQ